MNEASWFALCFVVFVAVAYKPFKSLLLGFLDAKIKSISDSLFETQNAKALAEKEHKELMKELVEEEGNRKEMLENAKKELEEIYMERCAAFDKMMSYRKKAAEDSFKQMKMDAASSVESEFLNLVVKAVERNMKDKASGSLDATILRNAS